MSGFLWRDGRLAWGPVLAFCISGAALVVGDYVWRVSSLSGSVVLAVWGLVVVGAVVAAIVDGRRGQSRNS